MVQMAVADMRRFLTLAVRLGSGATTAGSKRLRECPLSIRSPTSGLSANGPAADALSVNETPYLGRLLRQGPLLNAAWPLAPQLSRSEPSFERSLDIRD